MEDLFSPESCPSAIQDQIARKQYLVYPVLPVPFNLVTILEMEKVHYQGESVILGTRQLLKLQF